MKIPENTNLKFRCDWQRTYSKTGQTVFVNGSGVLLHCSSVYEEVSNNPYAERKNGKYTKTFDLMS